MLRSPLSDHALVGVLAPFGALVLVLLSIGCTTGQKQKPDQVKIREAAAAEPWTEAFMEPTGVIADIIEIEGPPGLIDHFAGRQFPELVDYSTEVTPEGLLHIYKRKDVHPIVEISAQLDNWELAAFVELRVLFAVDRRPVALRAKGGATVRAYSGVDSMDGELLEFSGDPWAEAATREAQLPSGESLSTPEAGQGR